MKIIPIKLPKIKASIPCFIDDEDFSYVNKHTWYLHSKGYAITAKHKKMHRLLFNKTKQIDHINGNGLDNRRSNLREATNSQNQCNRGRPKTNKSGYKGVSWSKDKNKWQATIYKNGKQFNLGRSKNIKNVVLAYRLAARELHGEFANW